MSKPLMLPIEEMEAFKGIVKAAVREALDEFFRDAPDGHAPARPDGPGPDRAAEGRPSGAVAPPEGEPGG